MAPAATKVATPATPAEASASSAEASSTPAEVAAASPAETSAAKSWSGVLWREAVLLRRLKPHLRWSLKALKLRRTVDLRRRPILLRCLVSLPEPVSKRHHLGTPLILLRRGAVLLSGLVSGRRLEALNLGTCPV